MDLSRFENCWFVLQVRPNYEQIVATTLRNRGYEEFLPRVIRSAVLHRPRILYPGYVFCRYDSSAKVPIVATPGVIRIVGNGVTPIPVAGGNRQDQIDSPIQTSSLSLALCLRR